jgi:hypothetical protein
LKGFQLKERRKKRKKGIPSWKEGEEGWRRERVEKPEGVKTGLFFFVCVGVW